MDNCETTQAILNWTAVFIRLSMSSFLRYVHTSGLSLGQMALLMHLYYHGRRAMDESILVRQDWIEQLVAALTEEQRTAVGETLEMLTAQAAVLETPESQGETK
jgi:DNA-binding MarR family transcriptional regulator